MPQPCLAPRGRAGKPQAARQRFLLEHHRRHHRRGVTASGIRPARLGFGERKGTFMRINAIFRIAIVLAAASLGRAASSSEPQGSRHTRSPSFKDGYADGCAAATTQGSDFRAGPERDEAIYKSDSVYRAGWRRLPDLQPAAAPGRHGAGCEPHSATCARSVTVFGRRSAVAGTSPKFRATEASG